MKTPEEIKKALGCCGAGNRCATPCPFADDGSDIISCTNMLARNALALIERLEEQIMCMKIQMHGDCGVCKHRGGFDLKGQTMSQRCYECMAKETRPNWEYEGLPEVKSK